MVLFNRLSIDWIADWGMERKITKHINLLCYQRITEKILERLVLTQLLHLKSSNEIIKLPFKNLAFNIELIKSSLQKNVYMSQYLVYIRQNIC